MGVYRRHQLGRMSLSVLSRLRPYNITRSLLLVSQGSKYDYHKNTYSHTYGEKQGGRSRNSWVVCGGLVAVGGYKAVAGSNGDLAGPVHEVPGLVPALAVQKQESSGDVSLSTGTGALVHTPVVTYYGKREAEADPALVYGGLPYAGVYG